MGGYMSQVTRYIRVATTGSKSDHIRSIVTVVVISENKVIVLRAENNLSTNNCTIINRDIKRITTNSIYSTKSDNALI